MNKEVYYQMSQKQLGRYVTISGLIEEKLTVKEAAISLGLSTRQILRLKKGVKTAGVNALIHKNSGRKPSHALDDTLREKIITLRKSHAYAHANFYHFQELLAEYEKITISYSALYTLLKKAGITSPKKRSAFGLTAEENVKNKRDYSYSWMPLPLTGYQMVKPITYTGGLMMLLAKLSACTWPRVNVWKDISR